MVILKSFAQCCRSSNLCVGVLVCCKIAFLSAALVVRPQSQIVVAGKSVELNCATNLSKPVDWNFIGSSGRKEDIYSSAELSPAYAADFRINQPKDQPGAYNLVIPKVKLSHAGQYICTDDEGLGKDNASCYLTVIAATSTTPSGYEPSAGCRISTQQILIFQFQTVLMSWWYYVGHQV